MRAVLGWRLGLISMAMAVETGCAQCLEPTSRELFFLGPIKSSHRQATLDWQLKLGSAVMDWRAGQAKCTELGNKCNAVSLEPAFKNHYSLRRDFEYQETPDAVHSYAVHCVSLFRCFCDCLASCSASLCSGHLSFLPVLTQVQLTPLLPLFQATCRV